MDPQVKSRNIPLRAAQNEAASTSYISITALPATDPSTSLPTIILLPFWGGNASTYTSVLSSLARQTPTPPTLALSYRGTGFSPAPDPETPEAHNIPALAADVLQVLRQEEVQDLLPSRKLALCAHSMSVKVTWELIRLIESTDLAIEVVGVLLLGPAPPGPFELPPEMRKQQLEAYRGIEGAEFVVRNVLTARTLNEEVYAEVARECVGMCEGAKKGWIELGMQWDCRESLDRILEKPPVRVLVGEEDKVETPGRVRDETVQGLSEKGFNVEVRTVQGCGHLLPVEAAEEVVEELGHFLR